MGSWDQTSAATGELRELVARIDQQARAIIAEADARAADALRAALADAERTREQRRDALGGLREEVAGEVDAVVASLRRVAAVLRSPPGDPVGGSA